MADHAPPANKTAMRRADAAVLPTTGPQAAASRFPVVQTLHDTARHLNGHTAPTLRHAAAALANRPAVQRGVEALSRPSVGGAAPIQLYAMSNGAKLSNGRGLCLVDTQELYAGNDQFAQANQIPGHVQFAPGAQIPQGYVTAQQAPHLHRVTASLKPDFQLRNSYFRTDARGDVSEPRAEDINDPTLNEGRAADRTLNRENLAEYERAQEERDGPLLPSNCNEAALFVSGSSNRVTSDENVPEPGSVYEHTAGRDGGEWMFHFATIIMADGADHVTMENAGAKQSENYSKKMMDKTWFYKMYGDAQDQTFAAEYGADLPGGHVNIQRPAPVVAAADDGADDLIVDDGGVDDHAALLDDGQEAGWSLSGALSACWGAMTSCLPGGSGNDD